jgi:putative ABC transport system permease protein
LNDLHFLRGRFIEPNKPDEVIVSGAFAETNELNPGDSISAVINGRRRKLRIVGVALSPEYIYEIRPGDIFPDNRRFGILWMNRRAVAAAFDMEEAFNDVSLKLAPESSEAEIIERLDRILERYGGLGAYGRADQYSHRFIENELGELEVFGTFIPAIFLGVTAFLLHLVLSRLVSTEREQIGLLKAFGYSNPDVGFHYFKLAFAAIFGGILFGIGLGWWLGSGMTALYGDFFHFPILRFSVSPAIIVWSFVISLGAASLGAASAVANAVKLPPAEAMRPEPPADFRAGFLERLGLQKFVSPEVRIILRNLARQPVKAILSAFGISLSVALLFIGFYFFDAINKIIDVQFNRIQREDVEVSFNEPRPGKTRFELASLPGVFQVETYRVVPARLRFENRSRRVALMGMESGGELRRVVDKNLRVVQLPPEGIVLTKNLADSLGAKKGDVLTVEVTEGARAVRQIEISAIVEELVGLAAYMDIGAQNRLMREADTISGAYLSVDSKETQNLYSRLKKIPAVSGVGLPQAALASFNETIARTIGTSTTFLIGFACVIAFGVVYNGARIALSERGRELASLRVLGFTQREIGVMLLGEQAILTALAIPSGYFIGFGICVLITKVVDVEIIRLPLVLSARTFVFSFLIVACAAFLSGLLVAWRLKTLDLIEVLKTRE